jgi:hypothetical protein
MLSIVPLLTQKIQDEILFLYSIHHSKSFLKIVISSKKINVLIELYLTKPYIDLYVAMKLCILSLALAYRFRNGKEEYKNDQ